MVNVMKHQKATRKSKSRRRRVSKRKRQSGGQNAFKWVKLCQSSSQNITPDLSQLSVEMGVNPTLYSNKRELCSALDRAADEWLKPESKCADSTAVTLITLEDVKDLDKFRVISYRTPEGRTHCFDVFEMNDFIERNWAKLIAGKEIEEPHRRFKITPQLVEQMNERIKWIQRVIDESQLETSSSVMNIQRARDRNGNPLEVPSSLYGIVSKIIEDFGLRQFEINDLAHPPQHKRARLLGKILRELAPKYPPPQKLVKEFELTLRDVLRNIKHIDSDIHQLAMTYLLLFVNSGVESFDSSKRIILDIFSNQTPAIDVEQPTRQTPTPQLQQQQPPRQTVAPPRPTVAPFVTPMSTYVTSGLPGGFVQSGNSPTSSSPSWLERLFSEQPTNQVALTSSASFPGAFMPNETEDVSTGQYYDYIIRYGDINRRDIEQTLRNTIEGRNLTIPFESPLNLNELVDMVRGVGEFSGIGLFDIVPPLPIQKNTLESPLNINSLKFRTLLDYLANVVRTRRDLHPWVVNILLRARP